MPASIQIIPREILQEQGATMLRESVYNASGVNAGGQDSKGYYDHFLIRGLNAQIYSDGFTDGDQLGGISHSLNGVERIEILEGPGSALFGSGPPGGTINIVHYTPSPDLHYGGSLEFGSFDTIASSAYITGSTGIEGLNYRVDETVAVANALLGYQTPHWGMDLNVHNLTNQRYFIAANAAGAYAGEPFSVFLNLHFNH